MFGKQHQKALYTLKILRFLFIDPVVYVATCTEELAMNQSYSRARFIAVRPYSVATCVVSHSMQAVSLYYSSDIR